ncbi:hypothetical protein BD311DRAFT_804936 [Dichomitus squalens]|uniref:Uncharacterized protein n=1 Tax=Dichomitus squalens TaxID=114155 RepID=A0A4Q9MTK8_9APHY|nr:hypothetical protein BD311DRAFT_804936 [Dichomitus squalens]
MRGRPPSPEEEMQYDHPINTIITKLLTWFRAYYTSDPEPSRASSARGRSLQSIAPERAQNEALRGKLKTHKAIVSLFYHALRELAWPANDQGPDKKLQGGHAPPKRAVPSDTTRTGSSLSRKRRSMENIPGGNPRPSKRRRT